MADTLQNPTEQPATNAPVTPALEAEVLLKLLLGEERLAILGLTAMRPHTVRQLAATLPGKRTPPAKHVAQFVDAGLLAHVGSDSYVLNVRQLQQWKRELFARATLPTPQLADEQILATFVRGGKIVQYPVQHVERLVVLRWLALHFEPGRAYVEREVNEILAGHSEDHATLRRFLVDEELLVRQDGLYRRTPEGLEGSIEMMLTIGFDADDTLWHNESLFALTQDKFRQLLSPYGDAEWIDKQLYATETRNLAHFGYGIKGFTLSMIETAVELTGGHVGGHEIGQIVEWGRTMLSSPVELLPGVEEVIAELGKRMH